MPQSWFKVKHCLTHQMFTPLNLALIVVLTVVAITLVVI